MGQTTTTPKAGGGVGEEEEKELKGTNRNINQNLGHVYKNDVKYNNNNKHTIN